MTKEIEIPEGYEAKIVGNKVVLEPKESEDERIRKEIISALKFANDGGVYDKHIAYLEKQKEQNLEDIEDKAVRKYMKLDKFALANMLAERDKTNAEVIESFESIEQQPVEWSDNFEENIRILLHDKLTWRSEDGIMSSTVLIDDKTLKDIINGIWFYVGKEALKYPNNKLNVTEWSEEDEKMIDNLIRFFNEKLVILGEAENAENTVQYVSYKKVIDWLKSLRPSWKPSKEQIDALEYFIRSWGESGTMSPQNPTLCAAKSLYVDLQKLL